jgi:type IV secretory pathway VirB3-like protein
MDGEALGVISKVRKSLVTEDRLLWVPYMSALANGFLWLIVAVTYQRFRCLLVGVLVHLILALVTQGDIHRLTNLFWYLTYKPFYRRS